MSASPCALLTAPLLLGWLVLAVALLLLRNKPCENSLAGHAQSRAADKQ